MKPTDDKLLQRLLNAAAKAAPEAPRRATAGPRNPRAGQLARGRARTTTRFPCSPSSAARRSGPAWCWCCAPPGASTHLGGSVTGDEAALLDYDIQMSLNP